MRKHISLIAAFGILLALLGVGTAASASQNTYPWDSADIKNESLTRSDLAPNSVNRSEIADNSISSDDVIYNSLKGWDVANESLTGSDLRDGSVALKDIDPAARAELAGDDGEDGEDGNDGADGIVDPWFEAFSANVANIGGKFSERATLAGTLTIPAGKYMITTDASFQSLAPTSGNTSLQIAVRADDGSEWGKDLGTAFTSGSPSQPDREVSASTTRVVTLTQETEIKIYVFGYENNGTGSADSGKFHGYGYITVVPVQN